MKKLILSLALAPLAIQLHAQVPLLDKSVAVGVGIGAQRYHGTFGDQGSVHIRGILSYHPTDEWLGTRITGGYGGPHQRQPGRTIIQDRMVLRSRRRPGPAATDGTGRISSIPGLGHFDHVRNR